MKNQADLQYNMIIKDIINYGVWDKEYNVRPRWKDGTPAYSKSIISQRLVFDNEEVPILTSKKVAWETAIKELLWIWQMKSNKVQDLRDMGVNIWNEWELEDGTIGKSYGYQLGKINRRIDFEKPVSKLFTSSGKEVSIEKIKGFYLVDQVDYLLHELINNPASRRHITTLWNPDDLDEMSLTPCVYETQWYVKEGKLSLEVRCRSNDMALGNPFNIFQYNVLQRMIAQVTGYELGSYIFNIGDAHIYDRHIEPLEQQMNNNIFEAPKLWINPNVKNFYDFKIDDFKLINYKHGDFIPMEVAVLEGGFDLIILIASLDMASGIGDANGNLLFNIPEDMEHFRKTTNGEICVFGRKTAESLLDKKPLPNRRNILLTKDRMNNSLKGFETATDANYILELSKDNDIYICGGGETYNQFFQHADKMILTHVHEFNFNARVFFPDYSPREWKIQDMVKHEEDDKKPSFTIATYNKYIK